MKTIHRLFSRFAAVLILLTCAVGAARAQDQTTEKPIIEFKTSIYETYGENNVFHFVVGATKDTYLDVDCGFGPVEYEVSQAVLNNETGEIDATVISCKVSSEGIVRVYGDASLLDYFRADGCYMRRLDISALTNLDILDISHNELEELDLTPQTRLEMLKVTDNPFNKKPLVVGADKPELAIVDFSMIGAIDPAFNISDYPSLVSFQAWDTMSLTWVDPTGCPLLQRLSVDVTSVSSLDVSKNPLLRILNISDTRIKDIDLSHNPKLSEFYCTHQSGSVNTDIKFDKLDLSHNTELYRLSCSGNNLTSLDLSKNVNLFDLMVRDNHLTGLDLSANTNLYSVYLTNNDMDFATLPVNPGTWGDYAYAQRDMPVAPAYPVGAVIDLSNRVLREGTQTYVEMYDYVEADPNQSRKLDESYYSYEDGKVTLLKALPSDSVYLAFGNTAFPESMMYTTRFKVKTPEEYGKPSTMATLTTMLYGQEEVTLGVGLHGATNEHPQTFYIDFGDGELQTFTATSNLLPETPNVKGMKKGYGDIKVLVDDGVSLSALGFNQPLSSVNVDPAHGLIELDLSNTGLYMIDLSWNRILRTVNLSHNNFAALSLAGVNSLYSKNLLEDINVSYNRLTTIDIPDNRSVKHLNIAHNQFTELSFKDAVNLESLDLSDNGFAEVNLAYCTPLVRADLSGNNLTSIVFPEESNHIKELHIDNNAFTYANLPLRSLLPEVETYVYAPQKDIVIPTKGPGFNLNDQAVEIDGHATEFVWKNEAGEVMTPGTDYEIVGGKTTFKNVEMGRVRCEMTHAAYPDMVGENALKTTYILSAGMPTHLLASFTTPVGGETVGLSFTAAKGSPALYIDWSGNDDLSQYPLNSISYTRYTARTVEDAKVRVYTYDEDETVSVFSMTGATVTNLDASPLKDLIAFTVDGGSMTGITMPESPSLAELSLTDNALTEVDLSRYPKLRTLSLSGNKLSDIDISKNPELAMLSVSRNEFTTLALQAPNLWHLDAGNNKLTAVELSGMPALEQLALNNNQLSEINVDMLSNLRVLYVDGNRFTFGKLPHPLSRYALYMYLNQAVLDVTEEDGKIDLSANKEAYGTPTKYTWYLGMPAFDEYGELQGEELYEDDEYVLTDGVTTFLKPFTGAVCIMTNELFPKLYMQSPIMNVGTMVGISDAVANERQLRVNLSGSTLTITASFDAPVVLYTVEGRLVATAEIKGGQAVVSNVQAGTYVLKAGTEAYKLQVK